MWGIEYWVIFITKYQLKILNNIFTIEFYTQDHVHTHAICTSHTCIQATLRIYVGINNDAMRINMKAKHSIRTTN